MTSSGWQKHLVLTAAATALLLAASSPAVAQTIKYEPGDSAVCDEARTGSFFKGTVVPYIKAEGAPRSLPGTAWKIDFGKGVTGTVFLFCKSGRWEIVPARAGSIGAVGKSYSVSGSTLTTVNADDEKVQKYKMTWEGDVLELFDGEVTLRLHYNGETQCK